VLADGTLISNLHNLVKDNSGYDLKQIFIGSEGTLGVITKATLKFYHEPKTQNVAFCGVDSLDELLNLLISCKKELGSDLSAFEVLWKSTYEFIICSTSIKAPLPTKYNYYVLIETLGNKPAIDDKWFSETLSKFLSKKIIKDAIISSSQKDIKNLWNVRNNTSTAFKTIPLRMNFDISVNLNLIQKFVAQLEKEILAFKEVKDILFFGHLGDNNLHAVVICHELKEKIKKIFYKIVGEYNGSISAEHGIGLEKKAYLHLSRSKQEIKLMKDLKGRFDPQNILNRNRIFNSDLGYQKGLIKNNTNDELKEKFRPEFLSYLAK
jgi:FAD/FMN-containing dehydrogenase